jgi:hypothetical protein
MKIETDQVHIVSGVRHSQTIGSPIALLIENKDWKNWQTILPVAAKDADPAKNKPVVRPRPGHADLPGAIKYNYADARYILERASARETAARVAAGALAKTFLSQFGIEVLSHVVGVGPVRLERPARWEEIVALSRRDEVLLGCVDAETEARMKEAVDHAYRATRWAESSKLWRMACLRASARTLPGTPGWMAVWRKPSSPSKPSRAWKLDRRNTARNLTARLCKIPYITTRKRITSIAAQTALAAWKAASLTAKI